MLLISSGRKINRCTEGIDFFGTRISYNYDKIKSKQKGKLKTELAHLLSFLSAPSPKDIILDPFAGYGAIPKERIHSFPYLQLQSLLCMRDERVSIFHMVEDFFLIL